MTILETIAEHFEAAPLSDTYISCIDYLLAEFPKFEPRSELEYE